MDQHPFGDRNNAIIIDSKSRRKPLFSSPLEVATPEEQKTNRNHRTAMKETGPNRTEPQQRKKFRSRSRSIVNDDNRNRSAIGISTTDRFRCHQHETAAAAAATSVGWHGSHRCPRSPGRDKKLQATPTPTGGPSPRPGPSRTDARRPTPKGVRCPRDSKSRRRSIDRTIAVPQWLIPGNRLFELPVACRNASRVAVTSADTRMFADAGDFDEPLDTNGDDDASRAENGVVLFSAMPAVPSASPSLIRGRFQK